MNFKAKKIFNKLSQQFNKSNNKIKKQFKLDKKYKSKFK